MTLRIDQHISLANSLKEARWNINWFACFISRGSSARYKAYKTLHMIDDFCMAMEKELAKEIPADLDPRGLLPCIYMGSDIHTFDHPKEWYNFRDRFHGWVLDKHRRR